MRMYQLLKNILLTNPILKVIALIFGFVWWSVLGQTVGSNRWLHLPIAVYNTHGKLINAPDTIQVKLTGRRNDLQALDMQHLALHIDATHLKEGKNVIDITHDMLLLPERIRLVQYQPSNIIVTAQKTAPI